MMINHITCDGGTQLKYEEIKSIVVAFNFTAQYTHGAPGKLAVEIG